MEYKNLVDASYMFNGCKEFNQKLDNWDVSKLELADSMFSGCINFNNNSLNNWNVSCRLYNLTNMFSGCVLFNKVIKLENNKDSKRVALLRVLKLKIMKVKNLK